MKNLHQEHFEDLCLTGDLSVLNFFENDYEISLKIDGSPSIVFGTDPSNGMFFVGTKSVFNKIKKKICYTEKDIFDHYGHQPQVAQILFYCLELLPRIDFISQADFIGFGEGLSEFKPNAITYKFSEPVYQKIIIAPHTVWETEGELKDAFVSGTAPFFEDTDDVKYVQPCVDFIRPVFPEIDTTDVKFLTVKEVAEAKKQINALIREGKELNWWNLEDILGDRKLAHLYLTMMEIKEHLMEDMIVTGSPRAFIENEEVVGEGFVCKNDKMIFKLVDRFCFSRHNFLMQKSWK